MNKLPIYKMIIPDNVTELGVMAVALVDDPAILVNWQAFNNTRPLKFSADVEKKIISGPLMIPNLPVYRRDEQYGEHYIVFDKNTIERLVLMYFKTGRCNNVNEMHDPAKKVDGVTMLECYFLDQARNKKVPEGYDDLPDGTWWASYKVDNPQIWAQVKDGTFRGFSIEGDFGQVYYRSEDEMLIEAVVEALT